MIFAYIYLPEWENLQADPKTEKILVYGWLDSVEEIQIRDEIYTFPAREPDPSLKKNRIRIRPEYSDPPDLNIMS